jgi:hypothetical protein
MALMPNSDVWIVNDNDGIDSNSGETQPIHLGSMGNEGDEKIENAKHEKKNRLSERFGQPVLSAPFTFFCNIR